MIPARTRGKRTSRRAPAEMGDAGHACLRTFCAQQIKGNVRRTCPFAAGTLMAPILANEPAPFDGCSSSTGGLRRCGTHIPHFDEPRTPALSSERMASATAAEASPKGSRAMPAAAPEESPESSPVTPTWSQIFARTSRRVPKEVAQDRAVATPPKCLAQRLPTSFSNSGYIAGNRSPLVDTNSMLMVWR